MNEAARPRRHGRVRTSASSAFVLAPGLAWLCLAAAAQERGAGAVDETRATLEQWVEARRTISAERRDWQLGRETLEERIALVQQEIEALAARAEEAQKSIAEADLKRAELLALNERQKQGSSTLVDTITLQEQRLLALLPRLPEPIRERIRPLSQRIDEDPAATKLSLGERFQNVVGILNEVDKFQQGITATSEVRALPDGTSAEVTALYLGIGQGYYASTNGMVAGVGTAGESGWVWTPANEAAPEIARAIAILKNEQVASYVKLPLRVR